MKTLNFIFIIKAAKHLQVSELLTDAHNDFHCL